MIGLWPTAVFICFVRCMANAWIMAYSSVCLFREVHDQCLDMDYDILIPMHQCTNIVDN